MSIIARECLSETIIVNGQEWYKHVIQHEYWSLFQATSIQDHKENWRRGQNIFNYDIFFMDIKIA